ncbi:hypothetical protein D3C84_712390 [compost metagenome]
MAAAAQAFCANQPSSRHEGAADIGAAAIRPVAGVMAEVAADPDAARQFRHLQENLLSCVKLTIIVGVDKNRPAVAPIVFPVANQNRHSSSYRRLSCQVERSMQLVRDAAQMLALQNVVECWGYYGCQDTESGKREQGFGKGKSLVGHGVILDGFGWCGGVLTGSPRFSARR